MSTEDGTAKPRRARRSPAPHERQRDPERTKARILEAAADEFSAKGFAGARVSEIASRAGVNQQLISYYFDGKEGLYREMGRKWLEYETQAFPEDMGFAEMLKHYVEVSVANNRGGRHLAWEGLSDTGESGPEADERNARLRHEVEMIRERQQNGEIDDRLDPAALLLITMSAANALAVYPQLARGIFDGDSGSPELAEHYADQLAKMITLLGHHNSP
ncbi:TetR/AcrR family transcriptional regulator [Amycolatopsis minnesotensis]